MSNNTAALITALVLGFVGVWFFNSAKRSYDYHNRPHPTDRLWHDVPQTEDGATIH
jgi:hypothetical protein